MLCPDRVIRETSATAIATASPKSSTFTVPLGSTMRLPGLRSRWTSDSSCATASTAHVCAATAAAHPTGRRSCWSTRSATLSPRTRSITRYGLPGPDPSSGSSVPTSNTAGTPGCRRRAVMRASRSNRRLISSSGSPSENRTNLTATSRSSRVSWPTQTSPIPPRASGANS